MFMISSSWRRQVLHCLSNNARFASTSTSPFRHTNILTDYPNDRHFPGSSNETYTPRRPSSRPDRGDPLKALLPLFKTMQKDIQTAFSADDLNFSQIELKKACEDFQNKICSGYGEQNSNKKFDGKIESVSKELERILSTTGDRLELLTVLKKHFYSSLVQKIFTPQHLSVHTSLADFRYPMEAYPLARRMKRTFHLHVGPTNSGKTYHALKRMREANGNTLYAGPLRMLAQEVYARMNATNRPTWLITGDDKRPPPIQNTDDELNNELYNLNKLNNMNISCTVEMIPLSRRFEVAVIDEIQMLADKGRGCHWTNALLGLCASEIHLCGEERAVQVVQQIANSMGDEVIVHRYERLTQLQIMDKPISSLNELQKGDCVVGFSIRELHTLRSQIQLTTGKKCAIVYGALPSEVRTEQAKLFNDPTNEYDFLVASDAIGMGLNLAIKRVIFSSVYKTGREGPRLLPTSDVKQIGGRAGRFRTSYQDTNSKNSPSKQDLDSNTSAQVDTSGYVTCFKEDQISHIAECMSSNLEHIPQVGFQPTHEAIARFFSYFPPGIPYSLILVRLMDIIKLPSNYFLNDVDGIILIADAIEKVKQLRIEDRIQICFSPVSMRTNSQVELIQAMANSIANSLSGKILDLPLDLEVLDEPLISPISRSVLNRLEDLHKGLVLYSWMSFRFPSVFVDRALANEVRTLCQTAINTALALLQKPKRRGGGLEVSLSQDHQPFIGDIPANKSLLHQQEIEANKKSSDFSIRRLTSKSGPKMTPTSGS